MQQNSHDAAATAAATAAQATLQATLDKVATMEANFEKRFTELTGAKQEQAQEEKDFQRVVPPTFASSLPAMSKENPSDLSTPEWVMAAKMYRVLGHWSDCGATEPFTWRAFNLAMGDPKLVSLWLDKLLGDTRGLWVLTDQPVPEQIVPRQCVMTLVRQIFFMGGLIENQALAKKDLEASQTEAIDDYEMYFVDSVASKRRRGADGAAITA